MYISQKNSRITESFEKFVNELKSMSRRCEFEIIAVDEIIRDKIINGMRNDQLRRQLITKEKLTCDELIKIYRADDLCRDQNDKLWSRETLINLTKNKKKQENHHKKEIKCRYCGKIHLFKKELCPAYGKICGKCS